MRVNPRIETRMEDGVTHYRVMATDSEFETFFGSFATKDEAEYAAANARIGRLRGVATAHSVIRARNQRRAPMYL